MPELFEPWKDPEDRKLVDLIDDDTKRVLLFFWHGLGDAIMFQEPLRALREQFPDVQFDITVEEGLGQEVILPGAVCIKDGDFSDSRFDVYDFICQINMPMSEAQDEYTKAEWCCITELGIEPVSGHPQPPDMMTKGLVAVHFHLTALPDSGNVPEDVAEQIWVEIAAADYIPMETLIQHKWHNPANERYDICRRHIREWPADIYTLATLLSSCKAYIGSAGGNFHLALTVLPPERIMVLERDFTAPMYTHEPVTRVNIKEYENGTVEKWLRGLR